MRKDINQIISLIKDLQELEKLADGMLKEIRPAEHKDGRDENHRPTELEKKLFALKKMISQMLAILTKKPKDKDEEVLMKAQFARLSKEMMGLLAELDALLAEMRLAKKAGNTRRASVLEMFIRSKIAQYAEYQWAA